MPKPHNVQGCEIDDGMPIERFALRFGPPQVSDSPNQEQGINGVSVDFILCLRRTIDSDPISSAPQALKLGEKTVSG